MCTEYYELRCMLHLVKVGMFAWRIIKIRFIFGVQFERLKVDFKNTPTQKLKHANSILESFEYFCQISWISILIILSYTVSKFSRFLGGHSVECTCETVLDVLLLLVDSGDEVKNLNRINKNNFARLPRAKNELSEQLSTAVCQFLASCMFCLHFCIQQFTY